MLKRETSVQISKTGNYLAKKTFKTQEAKMIV